MKKYLNRGFCVMFIRALFNITYNKHNEYSLTLLKSIYYLCVYSFFTELKSMGLSELYAYVVSTY